jgi:hypothetical protein
MATQIKITQLTDIGSANLSVTTLLPVVNMVGVPTTQKTTLGNLANVILSQSGGNYAPVAVANIAYSVANAAQPNITSVGTLTNVVVSGNVTVNRNIISDGTAYLGNISTTGTASITTLTVGATANLGAVGNIRITGGTAGQVLSTNGNGVLSWASDATTYGNSNVAAYLPTFTGNIGANVVTANLFSGNGTNLTNIAGANVSGFVPNANIANTAFAVAGANVSGFVPNANIANTAFAVAGANVSGTVGNANLSQYLEVSDVNNNFSYHVVLSAGSGDKSLHIDADDNLQYNPVDGTLTATRVDATYVLADLQFSNGYPAANVTGLGNIATINLTGSNSNVLYGNGVFAPASGGGNSSELVNGNNSFVLDVDGNVVFEGNVAGQAVDRGLVWDFGANANGVNSTIRQDNGGLTVRAWTEDSGNFSAPVNIVTNQDANIMFWEFDGYGNLTLPGNLIVPTGNIVSDTLTPPFSSAITGITTGNATVIVAIADSVFPDPYSGTVTISGVTGTTEANDVWGYQAVEVNAFQLYTDATLTTPVDGTTWTPYVSGGTAVGVGLYSNLTVQGGNVSIGSNGETWVFDTTGNLTLPGSIIGASTINIDNRASGSGADIILYAADDIILQARDRPIGSTTEGGDINIYAGDSAEDSDTSAGDIVIEAGRGGASNIDFGGSGGFVSVSAGQGGAAVGANISARSGGSLTLNAGDAGANNGNIDLGNSGGDVTINAGDSTGNGDPGGSIILRSGDAGANALAGQIQLIISSSDNGDGGTWTFDGAGIIQLPNSGTIGNEGNNIDIGSTSAISLEASSAVNIFTDTGTAAWQWQFQDDGNLRLPTIELDVGNTINEQTVIQSQRKIIPGLRYSAEINGTTPTVVYTATSVDTTSMKVTMQIQHTGLGFEFFDVSATSTGGNTFYTVSNRVQPPTISNSTVVVDLNGSNTMEITVTINSGAANSWVTYDATEFGIAVD